MAAKKMRQLEDVLKENESLRQQLAARNKELEAKDKELEAKDKELEANRWVKHVLPKLERALQAKQAQVAMMRRIRDAVVAGVPTTSLTTQLPCALQHLMSAQV